jgi:hypothetical protein
MRHLALQMLTWGTVAAAVVSALWLASVDLGWSDWRNPFNGEATLLAPEPSSPGHVRSATPQNERRSGADARRDER